MNASTTSAHRPWNKGKLIGQKSPLRPRDVVYIAKASKDATLNQTSDRIQSGIHGAGTTTRFIMNEANRLKYLKLALRVFALVFVFGVYPLTVFWPAGWAWHVGQSEYLQMIVALYATLGVFLWLASQAPELHISLISFTIWSSIVHAAVMAVQSASNVEHVGHLYGDVPALFIVAVVLGWLSPQALTLRFARKAV